MRALGALGTIASIVGIAWNIWVGWRTGEVVGPRPVRRRSWLSRAVRLALGGFALLVVVSVVGAFTITVVLELAANW